MTEEVMYEIQKDYAHGRRYASPEEGYPMLSFNDYVTLLSSFGKMAQSFDRNDPIMMPPLFGELYEKNRRKKKEIR